VLVMVWEFLATGDTPDVVIVVHSLAPKIKLEQIAAGATAIPLYAPLTKNPQRSVRSGHHLVTPPWARLADIPGVDVGVHAPGPQLGCRDTPDHEYEQHEGH
jgi:hypothetical protein